MSYDIRFQINAKLYLRDPQETDLGRNILKHGVQLIDEIGFEALTFKKLADRFGSTEASIYRYFENKHQLLVYLVSWYWEWTRFRMTFLTANLAEPKAILEAAIQAMIEAAADDGLGAQLFDVRLLQRIVVEEGTKAYHTKNVDEENIKGYFDSYKRLTGAVSAIILAVKGDFPYPHTLATNLIEMANNHVFFARHLPSLTDVQLEGRNKKEILDMLHFFAFRLLA